MERKAGERVSQLVRRDRQELVPHVEGGFRVQAGLVLGLQRVPQPLLGPLPFGDLGLERLCLLLQFRNRPQAVIRGWECHIALGGNDLGVSRADVAEELLMDLPTEVIHWIGAEEREGRRVVS